MLDYLVLAIWACLIPLSIIRLVGHRFISFFRRIGMLSVVLYATFWILCAVLIFLNSHLFLIGRIFGATIITIVSGTICFVLGMSLLLLGMKTIGVRTFFAIPEIISDVKGAGLVTSGLFSHVRHPIYLGELLLVLAAFLITSESSLIILFMIWITIIWPVTFLEEKELSARFGEEYKIYQKRVPRLLPNIKLREK